MIEKPRIRPVEAFPAEYQGHPVVALRDPQGYTDGIVFVPREALPIIGLFDGDHTVLDIQEVLMRRYGQMIFSEQIQQLINQLDQYHLLDSTSFIEYKSAVEQAFRHSEIRLASHAGAAYEEHPQALREQLDALFTAPNGPGHPQPERHNGLLQGLIAPHIDLLRGGTAYAHAYKALAESEPADLYVILGVAHAGSESLFILTEKDFETPLGRAKTDKVFVRQLQEQCTEDLFFNELSHKIEHSIEFQVIFLQHLFGTSKTIEIVPILVGTFHDLMESGAAPWQNPAVGEFTTALKQSLQEAGRHRRVCLIAGVDLSHVGRRFGDAQELTPEFLERVKRQDQCFLEHVLSHNNRSLYEMIYEEKDWRKVCGLPAIYTFLEVLPKSQVDLLDYQQWADPPSGCSVSFASVAFRPLP